MQLGLIRLLREYSPSSDLTVMAAIGSNQSEVLESELDETSLEDVKLLGGLRPTTINFGSFALRFHLIRKVYTAVFFILGVLKWPILFLAAKSRIFAKTLSKADRAGLEALTNADLVVWNGRNFRSDSKNRELYEFWPLLYVPLLAVLLGKKIACIGASIWPVKTKLASKFLKFVLDRTIFLSVREEESFRISKNLLGPETLVVLLPDLSLAYLRSLATTPAGKQIIKKWPEKVGVTLVDWKNNGNIAQENYVKTLTLFCNWLLENGTISIKIIPQVTFHAEDSLAIAHRIRSNSPKAIEIVSDSLTVSDLVIRYTQLDVLIATRMHSAIFAVSQGTPTVLIPYDSGGKWAILKYLGVINPGLSHSDLDFDKLKKLFLQTWEDRGEFANRVGPALDKAYANVGDNLKIPLRIAGLLA